MEAGCILHPYAHFDPWAAELHSHPSGNPNTECVPAPAESQPGIVGAQFLARHPCHRLGKPCSSQTPAPPRKRKEPKPTRVAELERRLEDLTARIESVHRLGTTEPSPPDSEQQTLPFGPAAAPEDSIPPRNFSGTRDPVPTFGNQGAWRSPFGHLFPQESVFGSNAGGQPPTVENGSRRAADGAPPPAPPELKATRTTPAGPVDVSSHQPSVCRSLSSTPAGCPWPEGDEAEELLSEYKANLGHLFPFAIVPPHVSSAQLREQKPFFWKAVMMEACLFDGPRQVAMGGQLLKDITEAAFLKPRMNLDLLQGLQMLIAWYHYNLPNFQIVNLLFLARSITSSLSCTELKRVLDKGEYTSENLEQMRALAGTYYLVTITFTTNKRPDALMSTSYLGACCRVLYNQKEYPTDELVVHLVRAQQMSQSISQAFSRRSAVPLEKQTPQESFVQGLQDRIRAFAATLPPHIRAEPSLAGNLLVAEILVYEHSLPELSRYPFVPDSGSGQDATADGKSERVAKLWECARLLHAFMANRWGGEPRGVDDYPRFICLSSFDVTYVFLTMLKLVTLQLPGWDLVRAREEFCFDYFTSLLIEQMERTSERRRRRRRGGVAGSFASDRSSPARMAMLSDVQDGGDEDTFTKLARKIRRIRDHLLASGFDREYASSQVAARFCDPAPMTLADATQDLMQDLGGGIWEDLISGPSEWDAILMGGEAIDWGVIARNYPILDSGFTTTV